MQNLPNFKYYPDPIKGGSISESEKTCEVCNKKRGYVRWTGMIRPESSEL